MTTIPQCKRVLLANIRTVGLLLETWGKEADDKVIQFSYFAGIRVREDAGPKATEPGTFLHPA
jgi:hypothetical protein